MYQSKSYKRLILIRHAPTGAKTCIGFTDIDADTSDHQAFERLRACLPFSANIVSSDLKRAKQTADCLFSKKVTCSDGTETALHTHWRYIGSFAGLREINFGDWEGKTAQEIDGLYPSLSRQFWESPDTGTRPPGGESWTGFCQRLFTTIDQLIDNMDDKPLIIVTHMGAICAVTAKALGLCGAQVFNQNISHLSVTEIDVGCVPWRLIRQAQSV